jgi:hypothetical protein
MELSGFSLFYALPCLEKGISLQGAYCEKKVWNSYHLISLEKSSFKDDHLYSSEEKSKNGRK